MSNNEENSNKPMPENLPKGTPKVGDEQATILRVNNLTKAFKAYEHAVGLVQKKATGLWEEFAAVGRLTKEEGEPILREFLKIARQDKEEFPSAVKTAEQYASRIRAGWKAGIQPNEGEGANAFYARAKGDESAAATESAAEASDSSEGGERAKLMKSIREHLNGMTNPELAELAKWLAHKASRKQQSETEKQAPAVAQAA